MGETILLGLVIGIIFFELTDISPGGLVVPGILAYYLYDPKRIALTLGLALVTWLIVKWLQNHLVLYGKRKFVVHIVIAAILGFGLGLLTESFELNILDIPVIGYLIPGIIANETGKQGVLKTYGALSIVTLMTGLVVFLL
ncbi:MAG: poly-gamma-glutamate biosynthesis protein PgsC [Candidatus Izemoplasmatales bacterium]|jgi:poly-gamma-glutamate biosynthesis protein PgsC/CapC